MAVYILRFDRPLGNSRHPNGRAKHYIGYAKDTRLYQRLHQHRAGRGSAIMRACYERGIDFEPVHVFWGMERTFERWLKNKKETPRLVERIEKNPKYVYELRRCFRRWCGDA